MLVITCNYGNDSIALLQYLHERQCETVYVCYIDTGWAAKSWHKRVKQGEALAKRYGFKPIQLQPPVAFDHMILDRGAFPTTKFQWCASFVKGLTLLDWLDRLDPSCQATIVQAKRRGQARIYATLTEYLDNSEHHNGRRLWYPLFQHDNSQWQQLIERAGFEQLNHRSLECDACIHSTSRDIANLDKKAVKRIAALEQATGQHLFAGRYQQADSIQQVVKAAKKHAQQDKIDYHEAFTMGCGSPWSCGE